MIRFLCNLVWRVFPKWLSGPFCTRSYIANLERSLTRTTQFANSEPNGEELWGRVRQRIEASLSNEWKNGAIVGNSAEQAYHVRCDRTTITQADLDNGRLICVVGVAPLKPAEFVIFRIGQWTRREPDP